MLAGMNKKWFDAGLSPSHFLDYRRDFHKVWPGTDDVYDSKHHIIRKIFVEAVRSLTMGRRQHKVRGKRQTSTPARDTIVLLADGVSVST
jgi:hypothetical protein